MQRPDRPIDVTEFARLIRIGLGRAALHLQDHDPTPYHDVILRACLRPDDFIYDAQAEGTRSEYLFDLIRLSENLPSYRSEIIQALETESGESNLRQLLQLARLFAQEGDEQARHAVHARLPDLLAAGDISLYAEELIELDGIEGFLFAIDQIGAGLLSEDIDELDITPDALSVAEERFGRDSVWPILAEARVENPRVNAYLNVVKQKTLHQSPPGEHSDDSVLRYSDIPDRSNLSVRFDWRAWGRTACDEDLRLAATDLLKIPLEDAERLRSYLMIFWEQPFPLDFGRLIELVHHWDEKVSWYALNALEKIHDPNIRSLGFQWMESDSQRLRSRAIDMFVNNYEDGDMRMVEEFITRDHDADGYHTIGFSVRAIYETHRTPDVAQALILLYDRNPCSYCREQDVRLLIELDALPDWMAAECRWDANPHARRIVEDYLHSREEM